MKAVILKDTGDVSNLVLENIALPDIKPDEILVKTKVFSINPIEVKTRKGNPFSDKLLQDSPSILGWDASGVVEAAGEEIKDFAVNDRVFGIIGFPNFGKTYAEYFVAKAKDICKIPDNVSFDNAAVSTIAALTAYQVLKHHARLKPGNKVLIHAASGGVGHFGVQLAKLFGAEVWATASAEKEEFVKNIGADHFIDYKTQKFEEIAQDMDVVFDMIGGDYIDRSLNALKKGGLLVSIPSVNNADVVEKAEQKGCRGVRFIMETNPTDLAAVAALLENEALQPYITQTFPMADIRAAHMALEKGHVKGKIAVVVN